MHHWRFYAEMYQCDQIKGAHDNFCSGNVVVVQNDDAICKTEERANEENADKEHRIPIEFEPIS